MLLPPGWQIVAANRLGSDVLGRIDGEQLERVGQLGGVHLEVDQHLDEGCRRMVGEIDDAAAARMPACAGEQSALSGQVGKIRDAPEPHARQANMPCWIW